MPIVLDHPIIVIDNNGILTTDKHNPYHISGVIDTENGLRFYIP